MNINFLKTNNMKTHLTTLLSFLIIATSCVKMQTNLENDYVNPPMLIFDNEDPEELPVNSVLELPFSYANLTALKFTVTEGIPVLLSCDMEQGRGTLTARLFGSPDNGTVCLITAINGDERIAVKKLIITANTKNTVHNIDIKNTRSQNGKEYVEWNSSAFLSHDVSLCLGWSEAQSMHHDDAFIHKGSCTGVFDLGKGDPTEPREGRCADLSFIKGISNDAFRTYLDNVIILPDGKTAKVYETDATHIYNLLY